MEATLPRHELSRRLLALIGTPGVPTPPNQLQLSDVARYIGRSLSTVRALARRRRDYTDTEQVLLSRMFHAVDRGELTVVKNTAGSRDVHRSKTPPQPVDVPRGTAAYGFEFTPTGPRLVRK